MRVEAVWGLIALVGIAVATPARADGGAAPTESVAPDTDAVLELEPTTTQIGVEPETVVVDNVPAEPSLLELALWKLGAAGAITLAGVAGTALTLVIGVPTMVNAVPKVNNHWSSYEVQDLAIPLLLILAPVPMLTLPALVTLALSNGTGALIAPVMTAAAFLIGGVGGALSIGIVPAIGLFVALSAMTAIRGASTPHDGFFNFLLSGLYLITATPIGATVGAGAFAIVTTTVAGALVGTRPWWLEGGAGFWDLPFSEAAFAE